MCAPRPRHEGALDRNLPRTGDGLHRYHCLLHGIAGPTGRRDEAGDGRAFGSEEKKIIRTLGASIHLARRDEAGRQGALGARLHLQGINHAGIRMDSTNVAEVVAVLRESKANGKGILGMKILGEGRLRDQINKTLNFVLGWIAWTPSRSARRTGTSWQT